MKKSVKVEAAGKKEALNKGQRLLEEKNSRDIAKEKLTIELIKKGKKILGIFGNRDNLYEVQISEDEILEDEFEDIVENVAINGDFKLNVHPEGIYLKVFAPEGEGEKVPFQEVKEELMAKKIKEVNQEKLKETIENAEGKWEKIAPRKPELDEDAEINIKIGSDDFRAFLDYEPALGGIKATLGKIKDKLKEAGVVYGIKEGKLEQLIDHRVRQKDLLIAEGKEPEPPEDEELVYHFEDKKESIGTEREDGTMDFYNRGLITNVSPGDTLVSIKEAKSGKPGYKVTGEEIPPSEPKTIELPSGKNVREVEEERKVVSEIEGQVVKDGKRVNVLPIHEVKGNVDINTGNINFVGNVVVKGDVEEGFQINAGGNVEVRGHVFAAQIESGGEVIIKKGFIGKEKGKIEAKGDIKVKFIENGHVKTEKNIIARDAIMHSNLNAGEDIIVKEKKGLLVGGKCQAGHHIEANIIGSAMATKTILEAGVNQKSRERIKEINEEIEKAKQNLLKTKRAINTLEKMKRKTGKLPQDKEIMYQRLVKTNKKIEQSISRKKDEKEELEKTLQNVERGKIKVNDKVFSGVKFIIGNSQFNVHNELRHSSFIEDEGEVRQIPL